MKAPVRQLRVLLMLPSLHGGGAERVAVNIAKAADPARFAVHVGLLRRTGPYLTELDPAQVLSPKRGQKYMDFDVDNREAYQPARMAVGGAVTLYSTVQMIRDLSPDVLVSFRKGMSVGVMAALPFVGVERPKWIAREGNNTFAVIEDELKRPLARRAVTELTRRCYASADHLITISHTMGDTLKSRFKLPDEHVSTVHNAIDIDRVRDLADEEPAFLPPGRFFVSVGRLARQKAFDVLIEASAPLLRERDMHLVILGQGEEEATLRQLVMAHGLDSRVHFPGFLPNPWAVMKRAEAFVLASRWEGFGNVVGEALALGLPAVVSDCNFGPSEIVRHEKEGLVVPVDDIRGFEGAMRRLLESDALRTQLGAAGIDRSQAFHVSSIVKQYCEVFEKVAAR